MPQVDPGAHDPRPVLHRRGHPVRGFRFGLAPAAAQQREHLVLGGHGLHRRDVDDLPALDRGHRRALQGLPAAAAPGRPVPHPLIRMVRELHRRPRLALRPAGLAPGLPAQRLRRRLRQPVRRRRLRRSSASSTSPAPPGPRPATAARPAASRSTAISASCSAICSSRSASSSRSRAFAARSPAASSGTPGTSGTRRTTPRLRPARK